jgi:hypothetical protein
MKWISSFLRLYDSIPHGMSIVLLRMYLYGGSATWAEMLLWPTSPQIRTLQLAVKQGWLTRTRDGRIITYHITEKTNQALTPP